MPHIREISVIDSFLGGRWSSSRIVTADDLVCMGGGYSFPRMMLLPALSFCHCIHIFFFVLLTSPLAIDLYELSYIVKNN